MASSSSSSTLETWAFPRLQQLLPLDEDSLRQVIVYTDTLPKDAAAEHLKNLLGEEPAALEFIEGFNLRRQKAPPSAPNPNRSQQNASADQQQPWKSNHGGRPKKKRANIHALPARQIERHGNVTGGYKKRTEEDYMPASASASASASARQKHKDQIAENLTLRPADATQMPLITGDASLTRQPITSKPPPSASGPLISDALGPKKKPTTTNAAASSSSSSRTASPAPTKTKVSISGGTAMHGASTALSDLDSAIRSLELQTNPTLATNSSSPADLARRRCPCMATRHPLLDMAPNCLECGKIVCVREGLGPCTSCGSPLLRADDVAAVLRVLKAERGDERTRINNAAQRRADVAVGKARAFTGRDFLAAMSSSSSSSPPLPSSSPAASGRSSPLAAAAAAAAASAASPGASEDESPEAKAKAHRDRLLGFQANNARRTRVYDEAADFEVPSGGTNMWASPAERAMQLKRQQKVLREMEWNSRPEWEKRKVVASIDLVGGKVVRRMAEVEKPDFGDGDEEGQAGDEGEAVAAAASTARGGGNDGGAFSSNPLAKGLIKPVARESKGKGREEREKGSMWRRVQMDGDDNEAWILDGGAYGGQIPSDRVLGDEEHAVGS